MYIFDFHLDGGQIGQQALDLEVALGEAAEQLVGGVAAAERFHHHVHVAGRRSIQFVAGGLHGSQDLATDALLRVVRIASWLDRGVQVFRSVSRRIILWIKLYIYINKNFKKCYIYLFLKNEISLRSERIK